MSPIHSLLEIRLQKKLSQERVAADVQVSTQTVKNWESGEVNPYQMSFQSAIRLSKCLDIGLHKLAFVFNKTMREKEQSDKEDWRENDELPDEPEEQPPHDDCRE